VRHDWNYSPKLKDRFEGLSSYGIRECRNCGARQKREAQYAWMRVTGYSWQPLVGRCKGRR